MIGGSNVSVKGGIGPFGRILGPCFNREFAKVRTAEVNSRLRIREREVVEELRRADFGTDRHLHFEIRPSFDDREEASYRSLERADLERFRMDPLEFFRRRLSDR